MSGDQIFYLLLLIVSQANGLKVQTEQDYKLMYKRDTNSTPDLGQIWQAQQEMNQTLATLSAQISSLDNKISDLIEVLMPMQPPVPKPQEASKFDASLNYIGNCTDCGDYRTLPVDCVEVLRGNQQPDGVYALKSLNENSASPYGAYCIRREGHGCTVIQRRQDGTVDFFRKWETYRNGFGSLGGEYWLGLERMHKLTTKQSYKLLIELTFGDDTNATASYEEFRIGDKYSRYQLTAGGFSGDIDDRFVQHNGKKFSTFDKDNDDDPDKNCANERRGAWWYSDCALSNLNGEYEAEHRIILTGLWWRRSDSRNETLKYVQMALCRA